jgi:protein O-GlcNAc transferase
LSNCSGAAVKSSDRREAKAQALLQQALALHNAARLDEAAQLYGAVLAIDKRHTMALAMLGTIQGQRGEYNEALRLLTRSLTREPRQPFVLNSKGIVLKELKLLGQAVASFDAALAIDPSFADAYCNRANVLRALKRPSEAIASYQRAFNLRPEFAEAYYNCGLALQDLKRHEDALTYFQKAISVRPDAADFHMGLGNTLLDLKRYDEAMASYRRAMALDPHHRSALGIYLYAKSWACDWDGWRDAIHRLATGIDQSAMATEPFTAITLIDDPARVKRCTETFVKETLDDVRTPLWRGEHYKHEKIRIAYLSADFCTHPVASLIAGVLETHDLSRFEITGISFSHAENDPARSRLQAACDRSLDVEDMSDADIAGMLRKMEIDIAIDLQGYTQGARTGIFAYRGAPVQLNYLGFPGTMALPCYDYLIADQIVIPPHDRIHYSEKIVYLPDSYQCSDAKRQISSTVPTRADMRLPETGFVFCSFNATRKFTPEIFEIWMRLLARVPDSVLWLADPGEPARSNLKRAAHAHGVPVSRLVFAEYLASPEDHLARLKLADLFLDTLPHNAHATASDALWAGLPVLTSNGATFAGRVAASLLTAIGLPELIANSLEEYEAMALRFASEPHLLAKTIKPKLLKNRETHPLFDTARFTRNLETAYRIMRDRAEAGLPPEQFAVSPSTT